MTCRHKPDDTDCSSHPDNVRRAAVERAEQEKQRTIDELKHELRELQESMPPTPDSMNYIIEDVEQVGQHLVLRIRYPNCARCTYEGLKIMVFLRTTMKDAIKWKVIDPHFRENNAAVASAPSPAARFPGSEDGWKDALAYAKIKS